MYRVCKTYEVVIFDWDGTLMDSVPKIVACVKNIAQDFELVIPNDNDIRAIIGYSLDEALTRLFGSNIKQLIPALIEKYRQYYVDIDTTPSPVFEGVVSMLNNLIQQDMKLAVATGKGRQGLNRMFDESQLGHYFATSRCADETKSKPDPLMLEQILNQLNVSASKAVMVGDSLMDLEMANNIGMDCIGVSYGAFSPEQLLTASPLAIIDHPQQLLELVCTDFAALVR